MATMGRKRANNPLNLPDRVYAKHGAFYYVHRDNRWEKIGTDIKEAKRIGNLYNDPDEVFGTMAYYLDSFILHCQKRNERGQLADLTLRDYTKNIEPLKLFFGKMQPEHIEPKHIGQYLDLGVEMDRAVRANREKACLSACFTWLIRMGETSVKINPCIGVKRNRETKRTRYVTHEEYEAVRAVAPKQLRAVLDLIYRTLQRPDDIITWTHGNLISKTEADGTVKRIIRTTPNKTESRTGITIDIEITPQIEQILKDLRGDVIKFGTLIQNGQGKPYTYDGLTTMLTRAIAKAGVPSFGMRDLKGKGATDMFYIEKKDLREIQALCGHASIKTTEIYIKKHWTETITPNKTNTEKVG